MCFSSGSDPALPSMLISEDGMNTEEGFVLSLCAVGGRFAGGVRMQQCHVAGDAAMSDRRIRGCLGCSYLASRDRWRARRVLQTQKMHHDHDIYHDQAENSAEHCGK